jgi:hypothetical protein
LFVGVTVDLGSYFAMKKWSGKEDFGTAVEGLFEVAGYYVGNSFRILNIYFLADNNQSQEGGMGST